MSLVFKTYPDGAERIDIVGAGSLFPQGKSGVPVADAALVLPELQERNDDGSVKLDEDGQPIALTGSKLTAAAKAFADARGFTTVNVADADIPDLPLEAGVIPDRMPMAEAGHADYVAVYGEDGLTTVNDNPDAQVLSGSGVPTAGAPTAPETEGAVQPGSTPDGRATTPTTAPKGD